MRERAQAAAARSFEELQSSLAALGTGLKVWLAVHPIMHSCAYPAFWQFWSQYYVMYGATTTFGTEDAPGTKGQNAEYARECMHA